VNGQSPEEGRSHFEDLTPAPPSRRLLAPDAEGDPLVRAVDLLGPLAYGQRVLILAQPRSGRTTLLRALGGAVADEAHLCVLLADERPEEVPQWERTLADAEIFAATADQEPRDQVREAELAIGHAKRLAEAGTDVVVLIDSLSRLALGYRDPAKVKRMFGSGRELAEEGTGSLTVVATVLDSDDRGAEVREALETTENLMLRLDASLATRGIVPALDPAASRISGEEELRDPEELEKARRLRVELGEMDAETAARNLSDQIAATSNNAELLARL
jgi:transcription termination factor Rho